MRMREPFLRCLPRLARRVTAQLRPRLRAWARAYCGDIGGPLSFFIVTVSTSSRLPTASTVSPVQTTPSDTPTIKDDPCGTEEESVATIEKGCEGTTAQAPRARTVVD